MTCSFCENFGEEREQGRQGKVVPFMGSGGAKGNKVEVEDVGVRGDEARGRFFLLWGLDG